MYLEMLYNVFNKAEATSPMTKSAVANKAFRRLAKNLIRPSRLYSSKEIPVGIRYSDLTTPLKERVGRKFSSDLVELSLEEPYKDYLSRVWHKDPNVARYTNLSEKLDRADDMRSHLSARAMGSGVKRLEDDVRRNGYASYLDAAKARVVPRITVYKAKTPYATTHHLAGGPMSLTANKAAQNAPAGTRLIENTNHDAGWKNYRGREFRINTPGAPWSPEELELMRTSSNLSATNLYETVFSRADRNFPNAISTYVPDTQEIRQVLSLKPDVKGVHIDDLQSKVQGTLYRGKDVDNLFPIQAHNAYSNVVRNYVPDRFKKKMDTILPVTSPELPATPERWFAPASRTSMGYAGATDSQKFIRLDSDALRRLRELDRTPFSNNIPELEDYTDADWANMFRTRHQQARMDRIIEQIENQIKTQRKNVMPENLYLMARRFSRRQA